MKLTTRHFGWIALEANKEKWRSVTELGLDDVWIVLISIWFCAILGVQLWLIILFTGVLHVGPGGIPSLPGNHVFVFCLCVLWLSTYYVFLNFVGEYKGNEGSDVRLWTLPLLPNAIKGTSRQARVKQLTTHLFEHCRCMTNGNRWKKKRRLKGNSGRFFFFFVFCIERDIGLQVSKYLFVTIGMAMIFHGREKRGGWGTGEVKIIEIGKILFFMGS